MPPSSNALTQVVAARRVEGMACPDCGNPRFYLCGHRVGCTRCNRRWSVTAGTVMAHTKLPLRTWFRAMQLMSSAKQGISAVELGRRLGISYPSAWHLHKRRVIPPTAWGILPWELSMDSRPPQCR